MNKTVKLESIEPKVVSSPALSKLRFHLGEHVDIYQGFHYYGGKDINVTRIFIIHDYLHDKFCVGEEYNDTMHGWYGDGDGNIEEAFWQWCFYPRALIHK